MSMTMAPAGKVTLDQVPGLVPADILASFREVNEEELPAGARPGPVAPGPRVLSAPS
jgi:hypothetical protein